jgi:hypothetical protein
MYFFKSLLHSIPQFQVLTKTNLSFNSIIISEFRISFVIKCIAFQPSEIYTTNTFLIKYYRNHNMT